MALFQRNTEISPSAELYTIGTNKTFLIIGLGNPEDVYKETRHNIGFTAVDYFAKNNGFLGWQAKKDFKCQLTSHILRDRRVILCKPTTYMNNSGQAGQAIQRFYRVYNQHTLVVYDELAIEFGQLRTRVGGSDAGHNGVKSLIAHIGDDFGRLRVGTGPMSNPKDDAAKFVLSKFSQKEQKSLPLILKEASVLITEFIFSENLPHETRTIL